MLRPPAVSCRPVGPAGPGRMRGALLKQGLTFGISALAIVLLARATDWNEVRSILQGGVAVRLLPMFFALAVGIALTFAIRWRMLVGGRLGMGQALQTAMLG